MTSEKIRKIVETRLALRIGGKVFNQWTSAEVVRDLKDFSGSFSFTLRQADRNMSALAFASSYPAFEIEKGSAVQVLADGVVVLDGYIDRVQRAMREDASIAIGGRDKTGDLVDSAALVDGPSEFKNVKLEDAAKRIAAPFGLSVRSEIDTGEIFPRYSLDLSETAFSAIEKGARARHALVLSDGVGGIVITRTGQKRAPSLTLPGNIVSTDWQSSDEDRHSETIVRGQGEKAGKERGEAKLDVTAEPLSPEARTESDGSATERERKGTAVTGRAKDDEIKRYRPIVHLARSKADKQSAEDEADWRMRTARGEADSYEVMVKGVSESGHLWRVNELSFVSDAFQRIERDMLISKVVNTQDESGLFTILTITSPEAFDDKATGDRRRNKAQKHGKKSSNDGPLDGTAEKL